AQQINPGAPSLPLIPRNLLLEEPNFESKPLPTNTKLIDIFSAASGGVIIQGERGSGKTTAMLELTNQLLGRAKENKFYPTPVVFNLTSWPETKSRLISDWIVDQLYIMYEIPPRFGKELINEG